MDKTYSGKVVLKKVKKKLNWYLQLWRLSAAHNSAYKMEKQNFILEGYNFAENGNLRPADKNRGQWIY